MEEGNYQQGTTELQNNGTVNIRGMDVLVDINFQPACDVMQILKNMSTHHLALQISWCSSS